MQQDLTKLALEPLNVYDMTQKERREENGVRKKIFTVLTIFGRTWNVDECATDVHHKKILRCVDFDKWGWLNKSTQTVLKQTRGRSVDAVKVTYVYCNDSFYLCQLSFTIVKWLAKMENSQTHNHSQFHVFQKQQ